MFETLGQYKILDRIGAGGMGEVYRARDTRLGRTVAIKVLVAGVAGDPARRERFLREARATAALSHPNIAALYEIGEDQGQLFLVFEFVPGETLKTVIAGRPLNPRRAIDLAVQIADALAEAHVVGIVHRDIKPANIIVTPKGNAKILDFGLAAWTAGGSEREQAVQAATVMVTAAGTTLGTVAYMSPEQALGEKVDQQTDLFSLGIVLFEMLTGTLPFTGSTSTALALQIVQAQAPVPSAVNKSLPRELDSIVNTALAKSLDQRYESAATLAAELRSVAAILDVRSDASEAAGAATVAVAPRRSLAGWFGLLLVVVALAAAVWYARGAIARVWRRTLGPAPAPLIAVTPLELAVSDASQQYFADGLTEDLITRLGQTPGLNVLGRSATRNDRGRSPRDVARELGAAVVLTGSVRRAADTVKVSLELIDPSDGTAVWSGEYTREVKDIFAVQAQIAEDVALALRLKLQPTASSARAAARLVDARAYELYLRGREALANRQVPEAIDYFERASVTDAGLAEAFAGVAEGLHVEVALGGLDDAALRVRLKTAAERAYQLDPDLPQANLAMGLAVHPLSQALGAMRRAVEIDPSFSEGYHQIGDQIQDFDPERAIAFYRKSVELDPRLTISYADAALTLLALNRWDEARRELDKAHPDPRRVGLKGAQDAFRLRIDLDEHASERALAALSLVPSLRINSGLWVSYVAGLRTVRRSTDAFEEASRLVKQFPASCHGRAILAGLLLERGAAAAARQLATPIVAAGRPGDAPATAIRCAVLATAAMADVSQTAEWLGRIATDESRLRAWALQINGETGALLLRGRWYPWTNVVDKPPVMAAKQRLDAAYAREREVVRTALAGLLP
jgi:TolB-like protein/predicted Ser/Thr protein kinase